MSKTNKLPRNGYVLEARSLRAHRQDKKTPRGGAKNSTRDLLELAEEDKGVEKEVDIVTGEAISYDIVHFEKKCWCGYEHPVFEKEEPIKFPSDFSVEEVGQ